MEEDHGVGWNGEVPVMAGASTARPSVLGARGGQKMENEWQGDEKGVEGGLVMTYIGREGWAVESAR